MTHKKELLDRLKMTRSEIISAKEKFQMQRVGAKNRNIVWNFTFDEWITLWLDSGHWYNRGPHKGQYVMSRFNDIGPYSIDNVFIQTAEQNVLDGNLGRKQSTEQIHKRMSKHWSKSDESRAEIARKKQEGLKNYWDSLSDSERLIKEIQRRDKCSTAKFRFWTEKSR